MPARAVLTDRQKNQLISNLQTSTTMSKLKAGAEEQLALFKTEETRERWRWVHEAIGYAKEANRAAMLVTEESPRESRPVLRRVR